MQNWVFALLCFTLPFLLNTLGACLVFFMPEYKNKGIIEGFAGGIMTSACVWSLIIPAIEQSSALKGLAFLPACIGLAVGAIFIYFSEFLLKKERENWTLKRTFFAMTLHNIPEGLAVGFAYGASPPISALSVALGIGAQNFPEGLAISLAFKNNGKSKLTSFSYGVISGVVEPVSALIGALLVKSLVFLQPWILSFSAGAMIYVVVEDLIPESVKSKGGVWGFILGFCLMMAFDFFFS